jgi:hypothetical protein
MPMRRKTDQCCARLVRVLALACGVALTGGCDIFREMYYERTGQSEGTLVANIGMPLEEVEKRSTLKLAAAFHYPGGGVLKSAQAVFDLELAGTGLRFERCRHYWLTTRKDDSRLAEIIIYATPSDWTWVKVEALQQSMRQKLSADGWQPGRFVYHTPEAQALHAGGADGYGNFWLKDDVLLQLDPVPTETQPVGSDPHAGQFTLFIRIHPLDWAAHPYLEFPGRARPIPSVAPTPSPARPTRR